jgi:hypothetical protein
VIVDVGGHHAGGIEIRNARPVRDDIFGWVGAACLFQDHRLANGRYSSSTSSTTPGRACVPSSLLKMEMHCWPHAEVAALADGVSTMVTLAPIVSVPGGSQYGPPDGHIRSFRAWFGHATKAGRLVCESHPSKPLVSPVSRRPGSARRSVSQGSLQVPAELPSDRARTPRRR